MFDQIEKDFVKVAFGKYRPKVEVERLLNGAYTMIVTIDHNGMVAEMWVDHTVIHVAYYDEYSDKMSTTLHYIHGGLEATLERILARGEELRKGWKIVFDMDAEYRRQQREKRRLTPSQI
jgi:hypothetical protein